MTQEHLPRRNVTAGTIHRARITCITRTDVLQEEHAWLPGLTPECLSVDSARQTGTDEYSGFAIHDYETIIRPSCNMKHILNTRSIFMNHG